LTVRLATIATLLAAGSYLFAAPPATERGSKQDAAAYQTLAHAHDLQTAIEGKAVHVRRLEADTRRDRDGLKLGCVAHQAELAQRLRDVGAESVGAVEAAVRVSDRSEQAVQLGRLQALVSEIDRAALVADTCLGAKDLRARTAPTMRASVHIADDKPDQLMQPESTAANKATQPRAPSGHADHEVEFRHDPTLDCDVLGVRNCQSYPLEYVAWASPFSPN